MIIVSPGQFISLFIARPLKNLHLDVALYYTHKHMFVSAALRYYTIRSLSCITHWSFLLPKCCLGWCIPFQWGREALQEDNMGKSEPRVSWGTDNFI